MPKAYLLDTNALVFWSMRQVLSEKFLDVLDERASNSLLMVCSVSFWEIALLVKKGRIIISDVESWTEDILATSGVVLIEPTWKEMLGSVALKDIHKDPFDRLLVAICRSRKLELVTNDSIIPKYSVKTVWG